MRKSSSRVGVLLLLTASVLSVEQKVLKLYALILSVFMPFTMFSTLLMITNLAQADNSTVAVKLKAPTSYIVKQGDTLWGISSRFLNNPWQWQQIWAANKHLKNPDRIYPGDKLLLCLIQGNKLVGLDVGDGCKGIERDRVRSDPNEPSTLNDNQQITITPFNNSIPAIPLFSIENWLNRKTIVEPKDFYNTPYIIASKEGRLMSSQGDKVYAKGAPLILGQDYGVFRAGKPYIEAEGGKNLGLEVTQVAKGKVVSVAANGISSIQLLKSYESEVRQGDRVFIEQTQALKPVFDPKPAQINHSGQIVRVLNNISKAGNSGVVAVNLGLSHGTEIGDVFGIYHRGKLVNERSTLSHTLAFDKTVSNQNQAIQIATIDKVDNSAPQISLPSERVGYLMIFKVFDKISYAYILESDQPLKVGDGIFSPALS